MEAKRVIAILNNQLVFDTKLIKGEYETNYLVHNHSSFQGSKPDIYTGDDYRYGWSYSTRWSFENVKVIETDLKDMIFPKELHMFEQMPELNLIYLFVIKSGRFKDFNSISITKDCLVKLTNTNTNRSLDIKIGRFVKALLDDNKDFIKQHNLFDVDAINTNTLERITNKYKELLNDKHLKFEMLKGNDILKGYTRDNYFIKENSSSLAGSCMGDKLCLLDLYTKNSVVELATVFMFDKIVARCLVWETNKGKYYDTIYSNFDWAEPFLIDNLEKLGVKSTDDACNFWVKLDYVPDDNYPYLDTFSYLNLDRGILYDEDSCSSWDRQLCETDGSWVDYDNEDDNEDD